MRIASNTVSDTMLQQIQQLTTDQAKLQNQVGTGLRITQPEDDPAAVGRVLVLLSQQREVNQYNSNASRALTVSQSSYAGLQSLKKISDRISELATLGNSATDEQSMAAYGAEVDQLLQQAAEIANSKSGNDYLYAGTAFDLGAGKPYALVTDPVTGAQSYSYFGNLTQGVIALSEDTGVAPGTSGDTNEDICRFLNRLVTLRDTFNGASAPGGSVSATAIQVGGQREALEESENDLVNAMATAGGIQTRIEAAQAQQKQNLENIAKQISAESSVDLPTTVVKLSQTQTAYQAALASAAKIMSMSILDYIR